ncbi:MAG: DUF3298 domain-containing protein [Gammaproteobacteria bacterium]|nr:DUF3298 domain-containing protein [Gammaproteobacteria bacterium]
MKKILVLIATCFTSTLLANSSLNFYTKTISLDQKQPKYHIQISYPQINAPATKNERQFNSVAKEWAQKQITDFKKSFKNWDENQYSPQMKAIPSTLTITYDLATLDPREMISLRYSVNKYMMGAAHSSHIYTSINYDLDNGKELSLADLFKPNAPYLQLLSKISEPLIKKKLDKDANGPAEIFKEGLAPTTKNYSVWNLTPEGIRFTFNEYQVAAYVFGPQEVTIPYTQVTQLMEDKTALSKCIKNKDCEIKERKTSSTK